MKDIITFKPKNHAELRRVLGLLVGFDIKPVHKITYSKKKRPRRIERVEFER